MWDCLRCPSHSSIIIPHLLFPPCLPGRETRMRKLAAGMGARGVRTIGFRRFEESRPVLQRRRGVGRHVRPGTAKRAFLSHWWVDGTILGR